MSANKLAHIKPAPGYLFIEPVEQPDKTIGGIYLPDTAKGEKPQEGVVLAVGAPETTSTGTKKDSPAKIGDKLIYKKWGGNEVKFVGKEYIFVKFEDVLAVI